MTTDRPQHIPYASPGRPEEQNRPTGMIGGLALMVAGLGLIVLCGCFLMGVIALYSTHFATLPDPTYWPIQLQVLPWVLYILAVACFVAGLWMLGRGVRWIYAVGR
jgi:hypothetical protein